MPSTLLHLAGIAVLACLLLAAASGSSCAAPAGGACADCGPPLFGDFRRLAPKADIAALPGATPTEGEFDGDIMLPAVSFAGHQWVPRMAFDRDRLVRVSLMARTGSLSSERLDAVRSQLVRDGYEVLGIVADGKSLDCIAQLKLGHALDEDPAKALAAETARLLEGFHTRVTYAWFDTRAVSQQTKRMARHLTDFLVMAPSDTREAEVTLVTKQEGGETMLLVDFTYPILDAMGEKTP
jgi:hypothetical protein